MVEQAIRVLWPLSTHYEYAAEVGLALRSMDAGLWEQFEQAVDLGTLPLPQAQGLAFVAYLEQLDDFPRERLEKLFLGAVNHCAPRTRVELEASVACLTRNYAERDESDPEPTLSGQHVALYAPGACAGYPDGHSAHLDTWTYEALDGAHVDRRETGPATRAQIARAHDPGYVDALLRTAEWGGVLTPETVVTQRATDAVQAAAGAVITAAREAVSDPAATRLCLVRPGSHHAERRRAGGTCLVNNLAVAAHDALARGVKTVAIVDIDAHHGNGTEDIFYEEGRVVCLSLHESEPFFPGTGSRYDTGRGRGRHTNFNMPVTPGEDWVGMLEDGLRRVRRHRPQLVLCQFSTDAHRADPVSDLALSDEDFRTAVRMIEGLGAPVVYELGASLSRRAWVGGVRSLIQGAAD